MTLTRSSYLAILLAVAVVAGALALGQIGYAQTALSCSPSSVNVAVNQSATLTASGGSGSYVWSGQNLSVNNATGNQFTVNYPAAGSYAITVSSGGLSATCTVNVGPVSSGTLTCSPATQTINAGQNASFIASGGNGSYSWSSPDLTISNATGSGLSASFAGSGIKTVTVSSGGQIASCTTNVVAPSSVPPVVVVPGLPNTGGGYGR